MFERLYCVHGIGLRFVTNSSSVAGAAHSFLYAFEVPSLSVPHATEFVVRAEQHAPGVADWFGPKAQKLSHSQTVTGTYSAVPFDLYRDEQGTVLRDIIPRSSFEQIKTAHLHRLVLPPGEYRLLYTSDGGQRASGSLVVTQSTASPAVVLTLR